MTKGDRKAKVLQSLVKRELWELESVKHSYMCANDNFYKANAELEETGRIINELSQELRKAITGDDALSLESLQMCKRYLMDKHAEQIEKRQSRQRAKLAVDKIAAELKYKLLNKRGLEQILEREETAIKKEREKKSLMVAEENWLQRDRTDS